ncbi:MAG: helix-turn-helix domain-containing protein [Balneolaceae bacterium]
MARTKQFDEEEVLNRALELFWKQGYNATSMQDLVSHLGINRASLYDTYSGKRQLFNRALNNYRLHNAQGISDFLNKYDSVKEGLHKLFKNSINESVSDKDHKGCFVTNTTTELIPGDDEIHTVLIENKILFEGIFEEYINKGIKSGEIDPSKNAKSIAGFLFMLNNGLRVTAKVNPDRSELESIIESALSVLD